MADPLFPKANRTFPEFFGGSGGAPAPAPADSADYLNTNNADYSTGSGVTWADSGADDNVITMDIGTSGTAATTTGTLFGVKFFDTGTTVADLPGLQLTWERVTSPLTNQSQWPVTVMGFIVAPDGATPTFGTHKAFWIGCKYAFTVNADTNGHTVRADNQSFSWTTVQLDDTAPDLNYNFKQKLTLMTWQRIPNSSGVTGSIGVGYWVGTSNYPGSAGGGTNLFTTTKSGLTALTSTDKIYSFIGAGAGTSGGSGTRTVTGRVRVYVKK